MADVTPDLIPRAHLFGNPSKFMAQISPDGQFLSWLAPVDGVLNLWVAPIDAINEAYPVTDDRKRGIRTYLWTYHGHHLLYLQDQDGDEKYHVYLVDPQSRITRDLTPFPGVTTFINPVSRVLRDRILVGINRRDPRFLDLHIIDLTSGEVTLIEENTGFAYFLTDDRYNVRLAVGPPPPPPPANTTTGPPRPRGGVVPGRARPGGGRGGRGRWAARRSRPAAAARRSAHAAAGS